jgi:hypothetical protein
MNAQMHPTREAKVLKVSQDYCSLGLLLETFVFQAPTPETVVYLDVCARI